LLAHSTSSNGVQRTTLHLIETGGEAPTIRSTVRLARAFGMSVSELVEALHAPVLAISRRDGERNTASRHILSDLRADGCFRIEELRAGFARKPSN
jgi:DNA-binding XRE family transcriptional regulator